MKDTAMTARRFTVLITANGLISISVPVRAATSAEYLAEAKIADAHRTLERGEKLAQICQSWLDGAKKRLDAAIGADEK